MKISATLKGITDSTGRRKVYIRIVDKKKRRFFATTIWIHPKHWNKKVVNHPDAKNLNERIKNLILTAGSEPQELTDLSFKNYANKCLFSWEHSKRASTLKKMASKIKKFNQFFSGRLTEVSPEILDNYVAHCFNLGNQANTVWTDLKAVRIIILKAYREKLIAENPFVIFTMPKYRDPEKVFLSKEQVQKIEDLAYQPTPYKIAAAWFVIACYTGLRYGDLANFSKSKIRDGRMIIYTLKTGHPVSIKLNDKLKNLLKLVQYKPLPYTNEHYNRVIKTIAAICKIKEKISSHTARHTFGTFCASAGISQEVTARLMGHADLKTTAIYYTITGVLIDKEVEKLF